MPEASTHEQLTVAHLRDAIASVRTIFEVELRAIIVRLDASEKAADLFTENLTRVPSEVDKQVGHLKQLHDAELAHVKSIVNFQDRVDRQLTQWESRAETYAIARRAAVAAEFKSLTELMAVRYAASEAAISKAEIATAQQIKALSELRDSSDKATAQKFADIAKANDAKFADLTSRLDRGEGVEKGGLDARTALIAAIVVISTVVSTIITYTSSQKSQPVNYPTSSSALVPGH